MPYTTQGFMTAQDIAEVRRDMDLDLCPCCESPAGGEFDSGEPDDPCATCGHYAEEHA